MVRISSTTFVIILLNLGWAHGGLLLRRQYSQQLGQHATTLSNRIRLLGSARCCQRLRTNTVGIEYSFSD